MRRDLKFLRRNSGKDQDAEEIENVPINPNDLSSIQALNPKPSVEQVGSLKRKCEWTPGKARSKMLDTATLPVSTPERQGIGHVGRKRLALSSAHECCDEGQSEMANYLSQSVLTRNGSSFNLTPRVGGTAWRANRGHSESCASTQNTPARSVSKPPNPGFAPFSSLRHPGSARAGSYATLSRRFSVSSGQLCNVNTVEVPHFDLKEDPSFWMDHNVQVNGVRNWLWVAL